MASDNESRTLKQLLHGQPVDWNEVKMCIKLHPNQVTDKRLRTTVQKDNVPAEVIDSMLENSPRGVSYKTLKCVFFYESQILTLQMKKRIFAHSSLMIAMMQEGEFEQSSKRLANKTQCDSHLRSRFARRRLSNLLFNYGCDRASSRLPIDDFIAKMYHLLMICPHICYKAIVRNCMTDSRRNNTSEKKAFMKRLIRYLLRDAPDEITTIARDQLDYDVLLEVAEEPWLLQYLISVYPECLHTKDYCGRFIIYDLAAYNYELFENMSYIVQKGIELEVGGDRSKMGGLLSRLDANGDDENDMNVLEMILSRDYYWDEHYKMKVLREALQITERNGIQINYIEMAIDLRATSKRNVSTLKPDMIREIVDAFPLHSSLKCDSGAGRFVLHHAIARGMKWEEGLDTLLHANEAVLCRMDHLTGLYPFMLAASTVSTASTASGPVSINGGDVDLETVYNLLRTNPNPALNFS